MRIAVWCLTISLLFLTTQPLQGSQQQPSPERVREAIRKGVSFLKSTQRDGNWEHMSSGLALQYRGGVTALALWALLEAGVDPDEDCIRQGLDYLKNVDLSKTYVVALQTMVYCKAAPREFRRHIEKNVDWLVSTAKRGGGAISWSYPQFAPADNSNTQYAILALREAALIGVAPKEGDRVWKEIEKYY